MKNIQILLVDDHQIVLDGISAFLEKEPDMAIAGYAHDGQAALDFLAKQLVDVVVLDISMPILDGIEAAKEIRKSHPDTKIILLTMQGDGHYILNAMKLGVQGYVMKEKSREILVSAIHSVCRGSTYWSPDLLPRIAEAQFQQQRQEEPGSLTARELEISCLMARSPSLTAKEIGDQLFIAEVTVQTHLRNAKQKLGLKKSAELIKYVMEQKLCIFALSPKHTSS